MPVLVNAHDVELTLPGSPDVVRVALLGATVYSYVRSGTERLFKSTKSPIQGPAAIRGGIPICWPIFGPPPAGESAFSKLKQHGLARTSLWTFDDSSSRDTPTGTLAVFHLSSSPSSLALFPTPFKLTYTVLLTASSFSVSLSVTSEQEIDFQALLHTYVRIPEGTSPAQTQVTSLGGLEFIDKVAAGERGKEERSVVLVQGPKGEVDRIYLKAQDALEISFVNAQERVEIKKEGLADVVLWNPGAAKGASIGDMEEGGAGRFICLEPGHVGSFAHLKAGETWTGGLSFAAF